MLMVAAPLLIATLLGFASNRHWILDLFNHGRVQYALALGLLTLIAALVRRRKAALFFLIFMIINAALIGPLYWSAPSSANAGGATLKLLQFNVLRSNEHHAEASAYIEASGAAVVSVQEVNAQWLAALHKGLSSYRLVAGRSREDSYGLALFVLRDLPDDVVLEQARTIDLSESLPAATVQLRLGDRSLSLLAMHTSRPMSRSLCQLRDAEFAAAISWTNRQEHPAVILGDLNATPWSSAFGRLLHETKLVNSQNGFGVGASWPAGMPAVARIPIDHCLHSAQLTTTSRRIGPWLGSDHRPLAVELAWSSAP